MPRTRMAPGPSERPAARGGYRRPRATSAAECLAAALVPVPAQTVPLPLRHRRRRRNRRASAARRRLSRSGTADRPSRTAPAGRLMLPAALLRLAAQHSGLFFGPRSGGSRPGHFRPWAVAGHCWGPFSIVGCRFALLCIDSEQHHQRGHEQGRSLLSLGEKKLAEIGFLDKRVPPPPLAAEGRLTLNT